MDLVWGGGGGGGGGWGSGDHIKTLTYLVRDPHAQEFAAAAGRLRRQAETEAACLLAGALGFGGAWKASGSGNKV